MAILLNRNLAITLLFSLVILLALAPPSSANDVSPNVPHRRDHVNLNRIIKKRTPLDLLPRQRPAADRPQAQAGAVGAAADPSTDGVSSPVPSSTPAASATQTPQTSQSPQSTPVSSVSSSAAPSVLSTSSQSSVSPATSQTPTTTSSLTPTTSSPPSTSSTPTPSSQTNRQLPATSKGQSASVDSVTLTSHAPAASSSGSSGQIGGSRLSRSAITILIIIAASVGGCVVVWTIIRKWKFRPSAQFGDRLEPVDWQPAEHDAGLPTLRRGLSNASSFHSAGHDNMMDLARSDSGAGYNRNLTPIPDHDFTAGAAVPVGGYADLARGPSPQPQMQEALQRGPSVNHGYENYQGGNDYNDAGARY